MAAVEAAVPVVDTEVLVAVLGVVSAVPAAPVAADAPLAAVWATWEVCTVPWAVDPWVTDPRLPEEEAAVAALCPWSWV